MKLTEHREIIDLTELTELTKLAEFTDITELTKLPELTELTELTELIELIETTELGYVSCVSYLHSRSSVSKLCIIYCSVQEALQDKVYFWRTPCCKNISPVLVYDEHSTLG